MTLNIFEKDVQNWASQSRDKGKLNCGDGLYLEQRGARGRKYWKFRIAVAGTVKDVKLGEYPELGLEQARAATMPVRELAGRGINPASYESTLNVFGDHAGADPNSFGAAAARYISSLSAQRARDGLKRMTALQQTPLWKLRIQSLDEATLIGAVHRQLRLNGLEHARLLADDLIAIGRAHQRVWSQAMFRLALSNQVQSVDMPIWATGSALSPLQLGDVLRGSERGGSSWQVQLSHLTLAYTVQRPMDVFQLRWRHLDLDARLWHMHSASHPAVVVEVPLAELLVQRFKRLKRESDYVFFHPHSPSQHITGEGLKRLLYVHLGMRGQFTATGWRHAFESWFHAYAAALYLQPNACVELLKPEKRGTVAAQSNSLRQTLDAWESCLSTLAQQSGQLLEQSRS